MSERRGGGGGAWSWQFLSLPRIRMEASVIQETWANPKPFEFSERLAVQLYLHAIQTCHRFKVPVQPCVPQLYRDRG